MQRHAKWDWLLLGAALLSGGCRSLSPSYPNVHCHHPDKHCGSTLSVVMRSRGGSWPNGAYVLGIDAGDERYVCAMERVGDRRGHTCALEFDCTPDNARAALAPSRGCAETTVGDGTSQSYGPPRGRYELKADLPGGPETLSVRLMRDESTLVDDSFAVRYWTVRPTWKKEMGRWERGEVKIKVPPRGARRNTER